MLLDQTVRLDTHTEAWVAETGVPTYGLGVWRDRLRGDDVASVVSAPNRYGLYPFVDVSRSAWGIVVVDDRVEPPGRRRQLVGRHRPAQRRRPPQLPRLTADPTPYAPNGPGATVTRRNQTDQSTARTVVGTSVSRRRTSRRGGRRSAGEEGGAAGVVEQEAGERPAHRLGLGDRHRCGARAARRGRRARRAGPRWHEHVAVDGGEGAGRQVAVAAELGEERPLGVDGDRGSAACSMRGQQRAGARRRRRGTRRPARPGRPAGASPTARAPRRRGRRGRARAARAAAAAITMASNRRRPWPGGWRCCPAARRR